MNDFGQRIKFALKPFIGIFMFVVSNCADAQAAAGKDFNAYILRAVDVLNRDYGGQGYAQSAYTHALKYGPGDGTRIKPDRAPYTMCVAAVAEVIITALNLYMEEHHDDPKVAESILAYLPPDGWMRMRPKDIRSHLWVDRNLRSYGTADALSTFGIGKHAKFSELRPGAFVNINRLNNSGHAVVFLNYIDESGSEVASYSPQVAGFRYFSSQGKTLSPGSGFGYRLAFFNRDGAAFCPKLGNGRKVDCGIIFRADQNFVNSGYMLLPIYWDSAYRDQSLRRIREDLYTQDYSRGRGKLGLPDNLSESQFIQMLENVDTMQLNPSYEIQDLPDE